MTFTSLRAFLHSLEDQGDLLHITEEVDPALEMTEVCHRLLREAGPAVVFERPAGFAMPVVGNLFGTTRRITAALGRRSLEDLRNLGGVLAELHEPQWPSGLRGMVEKIPSFRKLLHLPLRQVDRGLCQENGIDRGEIDLSSLPVQTCWPGDAGPLITWGLVITRGPHRKRQNIGVYRQQVIAENKVILRWLEHRGGAMDHREWQEACPGQPFPVAVAIGSDPATLLAAVSPIPDQVSEYQFAALLRGARSEVCQCRTLPLQVPASAEIVLEGYIYPGEDACEGPFGDHTGYYDASGRFPVLTVEHINHRSDPLYHSTYTGRPPFDEPATLAVALNEIFIPVLQRKFPEIVDFYLYPEACSYRLAAASIKKQYKGQARRIMFGIWSCLPQLMYTKMLIVTDDDVDIRNWQDLVWVMTTRCDFGRDLVIVENTPVDSLDFASPSPGLGTKLGIDATGKWPGETDRQWQHPLAMSRDVIERIDRLWEEIGR